MRYFIVYDDGKKAGPFGSDVLNEWISTGRLFPHMFLEVAATGRRLRAAELSELDFDITVQQPLSVPSREVVADVPRQEVVDDGTADLARSWVYGSVGLLLLPFVFSSLGIFFASQAIKKGHSQGSAALIWSLLTLIVGMLAGYVLLGLALNEAARQLN